MEQTKGRRAFCIGLSILIALLVWFYANDDTEIEISVNDVPIEFTNEDTTLADKGLMLLSNEEETIDLKLSMPRSTYFKLDPGKIRIVEGRHPIVERMVQDTPFVPNDVDLDTEDNRMLIITGPNMAGKSTYMRQTALITLMAHIGSFVPAREADISLCDRIFTRIGASDDLSSGQSTFMVEMSETAGILRSATNKSLVILDEIGRGTSTFDGLAIAWAVVEYLLDKKKIGAKTLFSTHYHELSELEGRVPGVKN